MCRIRVTKGADLLKKIKAINSIITGLNVPVAQRIEHLGPNEGVPSSSLGRDA